MAKNLEIEFHNAMHSNYVTAKKDLSIELRAFAQMLKRHGGVKTAKILVNNLTPSDGFIKLRGVERLDLTAEALVAEKDWHELFTSEEIGKAQKKLKDWGYKK